MTERTINAERVEQLIDVFGSFDENVRRIEDAFGVKITNRNNELKVTGDEEAADKGCRAIEALLALSAKGEEIDEQKVRYLINLVNTGNEDQVSKMAKDVVCVTAKGRPVKAKTIGQQNYLKAIEKNTITIGVGPAGTGKTYLAVAAAVAAFRERKINRIILKGSIPSPANPPAGCKFHTRCDQCMEVCKYAAPEWLEVEPEHFCACHLYDDAAAKERAQAAMEAAKTKENADGKAAK